jgi:hypothetical protein
MPYQLKKVSARKYKVLNTETGVEHSHATSKKKGEAQIRLLNMLSHQSGGGFFQDLGKSIKTVATKAVQGVQSIGNKAVDVVKDTANASIDLAKKVINPSQAYPIELQKLKDDLGAELITDIEIRRTPVPKAITNAMNVVSLGSFKKKLARTSYDDLFHLFIVIKTDKGHSFLLEKNARIHTTRSIPNLPNTTTMKVGNISADLTVSALIDNTQKQMGNRFLPYNPVSNNCQQFILSILQANKLATPENSAFVKQDTDSLFKNDPTLAKISKSLTDLGASADVLMSGGAMKKTNNSHFLSSVNIYMNTFTDYRLPQSEKQVRSQLGIPIHLNIHAEEMSGSGIDWKNLGKSIAQSLNLPVDEKGAKALAKKVVAVGLPSASAAVLGGIGGLAGPLTGIAGATTGGIAGRLGAEAVNKQIGSGVRVFTEAERTPQKIKPFVKGRGVLKGVLDKKFSVRDIVRGAKSLPGVFEGAKQDIAGAGIASDMADLAMYGVAGKKMPKQKGITSGVVPMSGMGTGKGSDMMKAKMAALRARKGKK